MRHILAISAVLVLAGVCLAAEFKSDEAKKAQADYLAAFDAAKTTYGQGLAKPQSQDLRWLAPQSPGRALRCPGCPPGIMSWR